MSSVVVAAPIVGATSSFLLPGLLLGGGVVIGGIILGSVIISNITEGVNQYLKKKENERIEKNCKYLRDIFSNSFISLENELKVLDAELSDDLKSDLKNIYSYSNLVIEEYKRNPDSEESLNRAFSKFNNNVMSFFKKIEIRKIEIEEFINKLNKSINNIENEYKKINKETILDNFKKDFGILKSKFQEIKFLKSMKVKNKLIKELEEDLQNLLNTYNLALSIDLSNYTEYKSKSKDIDKINDLRLEIRNFHNKINEIDNNYYLEFNKLLSDIDDEKSHQRLSVIKDQVKLKYGKLKEELAMTNNYKNYLDKILNYLETFSNSENIRNDIFLIKNKKFISKLEYDEISRKINEFITLSNNENLEKIKKKNLVDKIKLSLIDIGYNVIDENDINKRLENGEIIYIDTKNNDYKLMLKVDEKNNIATKLIRLVNSEEDKNNITEYQKQKDYEIAKEWCKDYDNFLRTIDNLGIKLETIIRKEPEELEIQYIVKEKNNKNKDINKKMKYDNK